MASRLRRTPRWRWLLLAPNPMIVLVAGMLAGGSVTQAQGPPPVEIETVTVGNPGNPGDGQLQGNFGVVDHVYAIGKYEVTTGQYAVYLNAVAATDTYGLYNVNMWTHETGCKIERSGSPGSYTYSVAPEWANRPVNFVSWGDAARFANWLHNRQPTGAQDLSTTEDGSYFLNGMQSDEQLEDVVREPDATWVIPTENEWYKAAYHKNDGLTANYWNYPTAANNGVSNQLIDPDPGNHATFTTFTGVLTIGPPYNRTEVGAHENSASAYGTFDQGGNVQEFNETVPENDIRGIRGGSWYSGDIMGRWDRPVDMHSSDEFRDLGFRVANVAGVDVTNLRAFDPLATYFEWDPRPGGSGVTYDLVRGDLASLSGNASAVDLGPLTCIEDDSDDESSDDFPDTEMLAPNTGFFYLVRFQEGPVIGPWGFGSEGRGRAGAGGCPP
jgi:formylglycine-generating enzyme required for sulfatase activity